MYEYLCSISLNVISGVILAVIFFCFREKVCPIPEIGGRWYFERLHANLNITPIKVWFCITLLSSHVKELKFLGV